MKILHVAAELAPIAKVGGMADVVLGLAREQVHRGHDVAILLPKYHCLPFPLLNDLNTIDSKLRTSFGNTTYENALWHATIEGIDVYFLEPPPELAYFSGPTIYGAPDELESFLYFSQAALATLQKHFPSFDILHHHDWHVAALGPLCVKANLEMPKRVFTLHNLAYEGKCNKETLKLVGLNREFFQDPKDPQCTNLLKGGIETAHAITTVSPTYAQEILKEGPLAHTLKKHQKRLFGILNGIDYQYWNPAKDPYLPAHFSVEDLTTTAPYLAKKKKLKTHLQSALKLAITDQPLVATICRLVEQKSPDLIVTSLNETLKLGGQFVLVGSAPDETTAKEFEALKAAYASNSNVHLELTYNEPLSHLVYAASDLFVVPSRFEPCGLTQLIAMRYGSVPLVRQTGGLADTVFETPPSSQNGFCFASLDKQDLQNALHRAFQAYNTPLWTALLKRGLTADHSWAQGAQAYDNLYHQLLHDKPT